MIGFGELTAPEGTLLALREVDPNADLIHLGENEWMLGVRGPNPGAQARINRQLRLLDPIKMTDPDAGREFQLLQLYAGGFRPIMLYRMGELGQDAEGRMVPIGFGWIVEDFRVRDYNWRYRPAEAEAELFDGISLDAGNRRRAAVLAEFMDQEGGSLFRHVFRKARSIVNRVAIPNGG